ncbi:protein kinase domain-containing protein [Sorangium sp. So ce1097]|uniref:protein kinase domain-containing protein n=1 Tax=Sorangium sp. So ce1097 TaxID=3133330 RepID=UPI003F5F1DF8
MVDGAGLGYRIVAQLSGRGRADVYAAVDRAGRSALLYVSASVPDGFLETLERLRAVSALVDELPRVLDGGVGASFCWAAVERCDGPSLRGLLDGRSRDLGPSWALSQVAELAEVLRAAHASGIFHGDLRPEAFVLFDDGSFKLAGLGLVQLFGLDAAAAAATAAYRAPEQLSTPAVLDGRTDVYALGLVLYELLGQRRPFEGRAPEELAGCVLHEMPPAIETLVPLPPSVADVVRRAIEKDPAARYRGMEELIVALHAALEGWCRWQADLGRGVEPGAGSGVRGARLAAGGVRSWQAAPPSPAPGPPTLPSGVTSGSPGVLDDGEERHTPPPGDVAGREAQRAPPPGASTGREAQHAPPPGAAIGREAQHAPPPGISAALPEVPPLLVPEPPLAPPQPAPSPASPAPASPVAWRAPAAPSSARSAAGPTAPGPRRGRRRIALAAGALALAAAAALLAWSQLVLPRTARVPAVARLPRPCALVPHPCALVPRPTDAPPESRPASRPATPVPRDLPPRTAPVPPRARLETTARVPAPAPPPAQARPFEENEPQPPCGADWYTCGAQWPGARSTSFH